MEGDRKLRTDDMSEIIAAIRDKKVLYIATKNENYIRLQQEIKLIKTYAEAVTIVCSDKSTYYARIIYIYKKLLKTNIQEYDIIFIGFMAQMILPIWGWKLKNKTLIVDFFISVYDTLVDDRKKIRAGSLAASILHKIDEATVKPATYVISDTRTHGKYFEQEFKLAIEKVKTLYLEADTAYYYPMEFERPEVWRGKFLVVFFGSILPVQGVEIIFDAIDILKDQKNIHFVIIGPVEKKHRKTKALDTVTCIDWLSQQELARHISYADLCLAGHFSGTVGKANRTIAGKTYIYKTMGKHVILGDSEANRELFEENEENHYVARGDSGALAEGIQREYSRWLKTIAPSECF